MVWKFEKFIFDLLPHAKKTVVVERPRSRCFAPVKNRTGPSSPDSARAALHDYESALFTEITGEVPPDGVIELSSDFYYATPPRPWRAVSHTAGTYCALL